MLAQWISIILTDIYWSCSIALEQMHILINTVIVLSPTLNCDLYLSNTVIMRGLVMGVWWLSHSCSYRLSSLKLSLDNWVDYNLAEAVKAMWSCPRERGRGALVTQCFFPVWDPHWSNLTFGLCASWGAPNVAHFLTTYESESRAASHTTTNNFFFPH